MQMITSTFNETYGARERERRYGEGGGGGGGGRERERERDVLLLFFSKLESLYAHSLICFYLRLSIM